MKRVTTPDGRTLTVREAGDPDGFPVLTISGTPGSSTIFRAHARDAEERGIRLFSYDRPGYGASTRQKDRSIADREVATSEFAAELLEHMRAGIGAGGDGWLDDDRAFVAPWGFDLGAIRVPVLLWQGEQDRFVPFGHGVWLAGQIPGVEARLTA